jgi:hypothetical protein
MARAIKRFAHRSGCIVIERCTWKKRKKIGHWALSPGFSGGSATSLSATGAWLRAAVGDGKNVAQSSQASLCKIDHQIALQKKMQGVIIPREAQRSARS